MHLRNPWPISHALTQVIVCYTELGFPMALYIVINVKHCNILRTPSLPPPG